MPPAKTPAIIRIATSSEKLPAKAQTSVVVTTITRLKFISRVLPKKSPTVPRIGCVNAYGKVKAVERSAAVLTSTPRSCAILGTTGSTARENSAEAKTTRKATLRTGGMAAAPGWGLGVLGQRVELHQSLK